MAENNSSAPLKTAEGAAMLWCVHVTGADDVHPMPSREVALEEANALNTSICRMKRQDIDPVLIAVVAEWPHSADSHAAGLMIRDECLRMRATPEIPATEDSSAGDLARHGMTPRDKGTQDQIAAVMLQHGTPEQQLQALATCCNVSPDSIKAMVAAAQAEVQAEPVADEQIKAAFLANGFTIKEGLTDLKPYVYQAARALLKLAAPQAQPADALDADGEAFRTAAKLGLTLRFYGGCAQSSKPRTPSAYVEVAGPDPAASMREAVQKVKTTIDAAMAAAQEGGNAAKEA